MKRASPQLRLVGDLDMGALLSDCGRFRYTLTRGWALGKRVCWVMLNPSTADAFVDDPTIRRCIRFSRDWGYGRLIVVNLFALRSSDPSALYSEPDAIGPENDEHIARAAEDSDLIVCAWGNHGARAGRDTEVRRTLGARAHVLDLTQQGQPRHPLYVRASAIPRRWP